MQKLLYNIKKYILTYDWEVIEAQAALFKICWGIWLALPFQSLRATSGVFGATHELHWTVALLTIGLLHFIAIRAGLKWRRIMTMFGFMFWLWLVLVIVIASGTSPLVPFFVVISAFLALNNVRLYMPPIVLPHDFGKGQSHER